MTVAPGLRRYLRVLVLEEEQAQTALEAAAAAVDLLEKRLSAATGRERDGRELLSASAWSGDALDRLAALEQMSAAQRAIKALRPMIMAATDLASQRREAFLTKRVERRQAETLVEEAEARAAVEASRRDQQTMDEQYLDRAHRNEVSRLAPSES
jgi:flagellar export protein FliJ